MYPIEKGIPLPPSGFNTAGAPEKYPFRSMEVGDSFAIPCDAEGKNKLVARISSAASWYGTRNHCKFAVRSLPNEIRVWRTA